jgi:hypothetical protein
MSVAGLLDAFPKPWANVNVNNLNLPASTANQGNVTVDGNTIIKCPTISSIYVGQNAGNYTALNNNTSLGHNTLNVVNGGQNTCVGMEAGTNVSTGANNTIIGYSSGANVTSESNNILIGSAGTVAASNNIEIGTAGLHTQGKIVGAINFGNSSNNTEGIKLNNNTASYTPTLLNFYERAVVAMNFTGSNTITLNVVFIRIGNIVNCLVPSYFAASTATGLIGAIAQVPERFRPTGFTQSVVSVINNSLNAGGVLQAYTNGDLYITGDITGNPASFIIGQVNGFRDINVSWSL